MITTDSRGVRYDISEVTSRAARRGWLGKHPSTSFIVERVSERPVDLKRRERASKKEKK